MPTNGIILPISSTLVMMLVGLLGFHGVAIAQDVAAIKQQITNLKAEHDRRWKAAGMDKNTNVDDVAPWNREKQKKQMEAKDEFTNWKRTVYDPKLQRMSAVLQCLEECRRNSNSRDQYSLCISVCPSPPQ